VRNNALNEVKRAFSLIEVNLAILLLAVGLFGLFSLFPLGLQQSKDNLADTHEALFANHVMSAFEGKAASVTNWNSWNNTGTFRSMLESGLYPLTAHGWQAVQVGGGAEFPQGSKDNYIRYEITLDSPSNSVRKYCRVRVARGRLGDFDEQAEEYYSELIYSGM
jgi:hypothetical protein